MPKPIRLIIHADDAGMSHATNLAVIDNLQTGAITSTSVMVPCPWFPEMAAFARENSHLDIGVHLTLTSEWKYYRWRPISDGVTSMMDSEGFMHRSVQAVVANATVEHVEKEMRAQMERALAYGMKPTHIDSHMFTLLTPKFYDICQRISEEYGIPSLRPVALPDSAPVADGDYWGEVYARIQATRGPIVDHIVMETPRNGVEGYEARLAHYHKILRGLKPGLNEWLCHPALNHPETAATMGGGWNVYRDDESRLFAEPSTRALIKELGIELTTWREVAAQG